LRPKHWIHTIPLRLRSFFRRPEVDRELADELHDHIEGALPAPRPLQHRPPKNQRVRLYPV
jgi:hypothetical protein